MTGPDFRSFVSRSRTLVDSSPPTTERETRTWLVTPFLETLGWDVHADSTLADATVEDVRLEYVLSVDSIPAVFVAVEPFDTSLEEARARELLEAMSWTGVDRTIYTNGREYFLLAGTTDVDRLACRLPSLPDHESSFAHFSRAALAGRLERHSREHVARQLALERAPIVESIAQRLTTAIGGGDAYAGEFESAAERFLDRLVVSFSGDEYDRFESDSSDVSLRFTDSSSPSGETKSVEGGADQRRNVDDGEYRPEGAEQSESVAVEHSPDELDDRPDGQSDPDTLADANGESAEDGAETDGEFVARFFNDRGSIGAIGHSRSDEALVHAAEYLFERGLSGIRLPWAPDGEGTVLNDEPTRADGSPMATRRQLSNGLYLETGGDVDEHAARVEALASRAGLRVMVTGDWDQSSSSG
ncbi:hypothetical protein [Natrarchaeobius chitinivorans]|uniref:Type I restriction enzyme R protein N-terminal domain-containing protein n=1 Tax=Natrarchaeobius chitinivorans TaxID=1679083 RepID=A0A3N6P3W7_NATCH|nr:hypothetical protein [Natrarchaeobius chitinivorans]RQG92509.1 hypothetical protein EA473_15945 [Natrarchaeobius chitinivorans]